MKRLIRILLFLIVAYICLSCEDDSTEEESTDYNGQSSECVKPESWCEDEVLYTCESDGSKSIPGYCGAGQCMEFSSLQAYCSFPEVICEHEEQFFCYGGIFLMTCITTDLGLKAYVFEMCDENQVCEIDKEDIAFCADL